MRGLGGVPKNDSKDLRGNPPPNQLTIGQFFSRPNLEGQPVDAAPQTSQPKLSVPFPEQNLGDLAGLPVLGVARGGGEPVAAGVAGAAGAGLQHQIVLDKTSKHVSYFGMGKNATINMEPLVLAFKATFGGLFNSRDGMGGGAGKKPTAGALLSWQGAELNYSEAFDLLLETHKMLWTPHAKGNSCKVVGKGALAVKVVMTDDAQCFNDLKQKFNRICRALHPDDYASDPSHRVYAIDATKADQTQE